MKEKIYRAAMVPFFVEDDGTISMKFMVPSDQKYGGNDPQLCKGKLEKGESSQETAVREAVEEVGLRLNNIEWLFHMGCFLGRTEVYICKVTDKEAFDEPHHETEYTVWMTLEEFEKDGRDIHKPVVRTAVKTMEEMLSDENSDEYDEYEDSITLDASASY